jgi:hypothetical protein
MGFVLQLHDNLGGGAYIAASVKTNSNSEQQSQKQRKVAVNFSGL